MIPADSASASRRGVTPADDSPTARLPLEAIVPTLVGAAEQLAQAPSGAPPDPGPVPDLPPADSDALSALDTQTAQLTRAADLRAAPSSDPGVIGAMPAGVIHVTTPPMIGLPDPTPFQATLFSMPGFGPLTGVGGSFSGPALGAYQALTQLLPPIVASSRIPEDHNLAPIVASSPVSGSHALAPALAPATHPGGASAAPAGLVASLHAVTASSAIFIAGIDVLVLSSGYIFSTVNLDTVTGSSGPDVVSIGGAFSGSTVDLGGGSDSLSLVSGDHTLTVANVETIVGGSGTDVVTIPTREVSGSAVDLGGATDTLTLASGQGDTVTVSNVEVIHGGDGNDVITIATALPSGSSIDLGGGTDTLVLAGSGNTVSVHGVESIIGSNGGDRITNTGATASSFSGGSGNDTYMAGSGGDTIAGNGGADSLVAGTGNDVFKYTAPGQSSASTLDVVGNFHVAGGQSRIDIQGIDTNGVAIEATARAYTGAFSTDFAGVAANTIAFATDGTNTYVYYHTGAGYSASDLHVQLAGVNANTTPLTLANFLHH